MMERIFVFTESKNSAQNSFRTVERPRKYAIPESKIEWVLTQLGSEREYLVVNDLQVEGTFDELVALLGERVDIK
jgi:hypothetical protein